MKTHQSRTSADESAAPTDKARGTIPPADALVTASLVAYAEHGIASRVLARTTGGNVTLFAFDAGQGLSEHTAPFDALVFVLEGALAITIGGTTLEAAAGTVVRMPASVPHALEAEARSKMLLVMLREPAPTTVRNPEKESR